MYKNILIEMAEQNTYRGEILSGAKLATDDVIKSIVTSVTVEKSDEMMDVLDMYERLYKKYAAKIFKIKHTLTKTMTNLEREITARMNSALFNTTLVTLRQKKKTLKVDIKNTNIPFHDTDSEDDVMLPMATDNPVLPELQITGLKRKRVENRAGNYSFDKYDVHGHVMPSTSSEKELLLQSKLEASNKMHEDEKIENDRVMAELIRIHETKTIETAKQYQMDIDEHKISSTAALTKSENTQKKLDSDYKIQLAAVNANIEDTDKFYKDTITAMNVAYANALAGKDVEMTEKTQALKKEVDALQIQRDAAIAAQAAALEQSTAKIQAAAAVSKAKNATLSQSVEDARTAAQEAQDDLTRNRQANLASLEAEKARLLAEISTAIDATATQSTAYKDAITALKAGDQTAVFIGTVQPIDLRKDIEDLQKQITAMKSANKIVEQSGKNVEKLDKQMADLQTQQHEIAKLTAMHTASIAKNSEKKLQDEADRTNLELARAAELEAIAANTPPDRTVAQKSEKKAVADSLQKLKETAAAYKKLADTAVLAEAGRKHTATLATQGYQLKKMNAIEENRKNAANAQLSEHDIEKERVRLEREAKIIQIGYNTAPAVAEARAGYKIENDKQAGTFLLRQKEIKIEVEQAAIEKAKAINNKRVLTDYFKLDKMNAIEEARKRAFDADILDDNIIIGDLKSERDEILRVIKADVPSAVTDKKNELKIDDDLRKKAFEKEKTRIENVKNLDDLAAVSRISSEHGLTTDHNIAVLAAREANRAAAAKKKADDAEKEAPKLKTKRDAAVKAIKDADQTPLALAKKKQVDDDKKIKDNLEKLKNRYAGTKEKDAITEVNRVSAEKSAAYKHAMRMMGLKEHQRRELIAEKESKAAADRLEKETKRLLELNPMESASKKQKKELDTENDTRKATIKAFKLASKLQKDIDTDDSALAAATAKQTDLKAVAEILVKKEATRQVDVITKKKQIKIEREEANIELKQAVIEEEKKANRKAATDTFNKAATAYSSLQKKYTDATIRLAKNMASLDTLETTKQKSDKHDLKLDSRESTLDVKITENQTEATALLEKLNDATTAYNDASTSLGIAFGIKTETDNITGKIDLVRTPELDPVGSHITDKAFDDIVNELMEQTRNTLRQKLQQANITPATIFTPVKKAWVRTITLPQKPTAHVPARNFNVQPNNYSPPIFNPTGFSTLIENMHIRHTTSSSQSINGANPELQ